MAHIGSCELARATRGVLWEIGAVLGANMGYSRSANTSRNFDLLHRSARKELGDDVVAFSF